VRCIALYIFCCFGGVCTCICILTSVCVCMCVCVFVHMCVYVCVCARACVYVCVHSCWCVLGVDVGGVDIYDCDLNSKRIKCK
jgi:hypothetical protein